MVFVITSYSIHYTKLYETAGVCGKELAANIDEVVALIRRVQPYAVLNVALPYQDLTIMEACLSCGVHYIDTANFEPENTEDPAWSAVYDKRVEEEGFSALFDRNNFV